MNLANLIAAYPVFNILILALVVLLTFGLLEVRRGASLSQLLRSVGLLTVLVLCPSIVGWLLGPTSTRSIMSAWKTLFWLDKGPLSASVVTGCWASTITLLVAAIRLAPNWIWRGYDKLLTPVTQGPLFESVQRIATAQRLAPPSLSIVRGHPALENNAIALGVARPQVVVGQQLNTVLKPNEMDFLIGHELRHHANGTLFWQIAVWAFAGSVTAIVGAFTPSIPILLMPLLAVGLGRVISRRLEFDCDRAGLAVSNVTAATTAMRVIIAGTIFGDFNRWQALADAMQTHPSLAARIAAVHGNDKAGELQIGASLTLQRRLGWIAVFAFLGVAAFAVHQAILGNNDWLVASTICVMAVPQLAAFAAARLGLKTQQILDRGVTPKLWNRRVRLMFGVTCLGLVTVFALVLTDSNDGADSTFKILIVATVLLLTVVSLIATLGVMFYRQRLVRRRWVKESSIAVANADYETALEILIKSKAPKALAVMHAVLTISALKGLGRETDALLQLRRLVESRPDVVRSHLLHGFLAIECNLIGEAVTASAEVVRLVPNFSVGLAFRGSALVDRHKLVMGSDQSQEVTSERSHLSERDVPSSDSALANTEGIIEAANLSDRLRLIDRRSADVLDAEIAIASDDLETARELLQKIDSHSPGQISGTLLRLDLALAEADQEAAVEAAQALLDYANKQPNQWLDRRALRAAVRVTERFEEELTIPDRLAALPPLPSTETLSRKAK